MPEISIAIVVIVVFLLVAQRVGFTAAAGASVLFATCVYPHTLWGASAVKHVDIAGASPTLTTYNLILVALLVCVLLFGRLDKTSVLIWLPFVLWISMGLAFIWGGTQEHWAGIIQLASAPMAWLVGSSVGRTVVVRSRAADVLCVSISAVIAIQLAVTLLQSLGVPINPMALYQQAILPGRFNGTLAHPDDLGKVIFLLLITLLGLYRTVRTSMRRLILIAYGAGFVVLALTGGRAVLVSALIAVVLVAILIPSNGRRLGLRVGILAGAGVIALFVVGIIAARFDEDPDGGSRSTLNSLAFAQIALRPFAGTGPNSYVTVVGQYDALTATGVPVHNALLLAVGELGIVGGVLLLLPLLLLAWLALRRFRSESVQGDFARAFLAAAPGIYLAGATGWGLLGSSVLPCFMFVLGLLFGALRAPVSPRADAVNGLDVAFRVALEAGADERNRPSTPPRVHKSPLIE